jgi:hypothetical protein
MKNDSESARRVNGTIANQTKQAAARCLLPWIYFYEGVEK